MNIASHPSVASAEPAKIVKSNAQRIFAAACQIAIQLERGQLITTAVLSQIMTHAFDGTDAEGAWVWKQAYDACEAAQVLFLQKYSRSIMDRAANRQAVLVMLTKLASLLPTHTRRSDESQALQQLSTPLPLAFVAAQAVSPSSADMVLEPSAGAGMLAVFASITNARLILNEVAFAPNCS